MATLRYCSLFSYHSLSLKSINEQEIVSKKDTEEKKKLTRVKRNENKRLLASSSCAYGDTVSPKHRIRSYECIVLSKACSCSVNKHTYIPILQLPFIIFAQCDDLIVCALTVRYSFLSVSFGISFFSFFNFKFLNNFVIVSFFLFSSFAFFIVALMFRLVFCSSPPFRSLYECVSVCVLSVLHTQFRRFKLWSNRVAVLTFAQ